MLKNLITINLCLFMFGFVFSQNPTKHKREISCTEFVNGILNSEDSEYTLEDTKVTYDPVKDKDSPYFSKENGFTFKSNKTIHLIRCSVYPGFSNCKFQDLYLSDPLDFFVNFDNCVINGQLYISSEEGISENSHIFINECTFKGGLGLYGNKKLFTITISKNQFIADSTKWSRWQNELTIPNKFFSGFGTQLDIGSKINAEKIKILNCSFKADSKLKLVSLRYQDGEIDHFRISNSDIVSIDFTQLKINKSFYLTNCKISNSICLNNTQFADNNVNANIDWNSISGEKITSFPLDSIRDENFLNNQYQARTKEQLSHNENYDDLLNIYSILSNNYRKRNDQQKANGIYVEIKDIETRKYKYIYEKDRSLQNWINWKLNQFLKFFCDYGTNPVRSLIISLYTVLIFSVLYFFFYSEWDRINRTFLIAKHQKIIYYLENDLKLEDLYKNERYEQMKNENDSYLKYKNSKSKVPYFIYFIGKPLYIISSIKHKLSLFFYRRIEITKGRWSELTKRQRNVRGTIITTFIIFYMLFLILTRALNSFFLSVNTFSTLGFGEIPVKGISRYMAILEGFLGWFLLSIFSVSLISQILQS